MSVTKKEIFCLQANVANGNRKFSYQQLRNKRNLNKQAKEIKENLHPKKEKNPKQNA